MPGDCHDKIDVTFALGTLTLAGLLIRGADTLGERIDRLRHSAAALKGDVRCMFSWQVQAEQSASR